MYRAKKNILEVILCQDLKPDEVGNLLLILKCFFWRFVSLIKYEGCFLRVCCLSHPDCFCFLCRTPACRQKSPKKTHCHLHILSRPPSLQKIIVIPLLFRTDPHSQRSSSPSTTILQNSLRKQKLTRMKTASRTLITP